MGANLVKIDNAAENAWIVSKRGKHHVSIIALRINIIADSLMLLGSSAYIIFSNIFNISCMKYSAHYSLL